MIPIKSAKRTFIMLSLALAGCRGTLPAASPTPEAYSLRLLADNATAPLLRELVSNYQPAQALIAWDIDIGEASTVLKWLEDSNAPYALLGHVPPGALPSGSAAASLWVTPVGQRGVAFVVHPTNPVKDLSADQLRALLQGQITNWASVGGPNLPVTIIAREEQSSDAALVQAIVLGDRRTVGAARLATTGQAVIDLVSQSPGALGYVSTGYLTDRVRAVAVEGVLPTSAALTAEQYPIRSPILFVGRSEPGNDEYRAFFAWVQSPEGQAIVRRRYGGLVN